MCYQSFRAVHELAEACGVFTLECRACDSPKVTALAYRRLALSI